MDNLPKWQANNTALTPLTFLMRAAACYANRTSVIHEGTRFTWAQTYERCRRLAFSLRALNVARNDVVSVLAPNIPAMYEMHFAVPMAGAVLNTINTRLDAKNIATILSHSEAKVFFVDYEYVSKAKDALRLLMDNNNLQKGGPKPTNQQHSTFSLPLVIVIDDINSPTGIRLGELEYEQLVHHGNPNYVPETIQDEWTPIALNYTSGTTSAPKGVVYSHRGAYLSTLSLILGWEMGSEPVYLWTLPMFHCNGWTFTWGVAARGGTNVCLRTTAARDIYRNIVLHNVTHMCCAPIVFNIILEAKPSERRDIKLNGKSPVEILTGGAPPPASLLEQIESLGFHVTHAYGRNMCPYMQNMGLGPEITNSQAQGVLTNNTWYATNQFLLEVIFHNRMNKYGCLTNDSSLASAIFVPFYAGLDVSRFLWLSNITERDSSARDLVQWLAKRPEWKKMSGRDHFLVSGRIAWDFRRQYDDQSYWGSKFRFLPESINMSMLAVEASSWNNDHAIPYPTSFHPSEDTHVSQWQRKIRHQNRPYLFTFTGAPRPELEGSIRGKIIDQCRASSVCKFVDCSYGVERCDDPINVIKVFESSVFCLQPPGDSYTRRSIFDSMLAGCIPVFFHPGTAYSQYKWHLPKNRTKYSVYIPVKDVKQWNVNVEKVLLGIPKGEVFAMREEVIKLVPNIIYADPRSKLDYFEDAFDLAVKGMLERIEKVREAMRSGRDPSIGFADEDHYKYTFSQNYS